MTLRARWKARLAVRKALLAKAQRGLRYWRTRKAREPKHSKAWNHAGHMILQRRADIEKREAQVAQAERVLERHKALRLRAWDQMAKLIDAKVTEQGGNNRGPEVEQIILANHGVIGEPWCGDTVAACYLWAGCKSVVRAWASVSFLEKLLTRVLSPKKGHVVIYTFSHTGLFEKWAPDHGPGWFWAGEGNTGNTGAASDSITGGDGVKLKLRHTSLVSSFRRVLK